jgi:plastocyanin domain-containing protein
MNNTQIIVTLAGLTMIGLIVWYFWLWKGDSATARSAAEGGVMEINVTVKGGYQPATVVAKAGQLLRLNFTRREASLCGEEIVLPDFGKRAHLPQDKTIAVEVTPEKPGEYEFTCGMNMYRGKLIVE